VFIQLSAKAAREIKSKMSEMQALQDVANNPRAGLAERDEAKHAGMLLMNEVYGLSGREKVSFLALTPHPNHPNLQYTISYETSSYSSRPSHRRPKPSSCNLPTSRFHLPVPHITNPTAHPESG